MSGDSFNLREELERRKGRLEDELAVTEARLAALRAEAAALDQEFAAMEQLASKFGFALVPAVDRGLYGFDGTVPGLGASYLAHPESPYAQVRHATRVHYERLVRHISRECAGTKVSELDQDRINALYQHYSKGGKTASLGHAYITMLRGLATFGHTVLRDKDCTQLRMELHLFKLPGVAKARLQGITETQAREIIRVAHLMGFRSIALAQAFMYGCKLGQKDVIGEWVPIDERTPPSDYIRGTKKWARGIRLNEIDTEAKILRHPASNGGKLIEVRYGDIPIVTDELARYPDLPKIGALVVHDRKKVPWQGIEFRRKWREIANAAGIPKEIGSDDSRRHADDPTPNEAEEIEESDPAQELRV